MASFDIRVVDNNWVYSNNVRPLLEAFSFWAGYSFDDSDWLAVDDGLSSTNVEAAKWFRYPLIGSELSLEVGLAADPGADPVFVGVWSAVELSVIQKTQIETTQTVFHNLDGH